ncbi:MAG TPA: DUF4255 domain-containing protein [Actinocrinis sp.]|nr:DUF4255 domain-containing protein [Actinocrinis sp.]
MILETDQALLAVTKTRVLGNAAVTVTFDPPARPWIQALKTPAVNFFLFDIRENTHRRDVMYEQVRDEGGKVVGHRPPALRYDLHYTVTVWGAPIAMEHRILALVLRCFGALPTMPRELMPEALGKLPYEVHLTTAAGTKRGMFLNLAGEVKAGFELTATVAMPAPDLPAAPAVSQAQVTVGPKPTGSAPPPAGQAPPNATPGAPAVPAGTGAPETVRHGAPAAQSASQPAATAATASAQAAAPAAAVATTAPTEPTAPTKPKEPTAPTGAQNADPASQPAAGPN